MLDLHNHIIPGVDDGARDYEDSMEMAELAVECGVTTIVATPHANQMGRFENFYTPELARKFDRLQEMLRSNQIPLKVLEGQEIMASENMVRKIKDGRLISLNNTQYYLIEFPFESDPSWIYDRLADILHLGKIPLIAHVERYSCVQYDPGYVYEWIQMGCVTQLNKGSVFGRFGRAAKYASVPLLNFELIHCIASDAHSPIRRTSWLGDIWDFLVENYDEEYAYRMLEGNPKKIIGGKTVSSFAREPVLRRHSDDIY